MSDLATTRRFMQHDNAFGALRLLFASLVIVSHTPEMVDGNRSREILTVLFGTISFGELAVDAFFLISGFLISASFTKDPNPLSYLIKRVARIYPGFIAATLFCLLIVAPLGGGHPPVGMIEWVKNGIRALLLLPPDQTQSLGAFKSTPYPALNGAAWTISYEFRCYILVMVLGLLGILRSTTLLLVLAVVMIVMFEVTPVKSLNAIDRIIPGGYLWWGQTSPSLRLYGIFLVGAVFYNIRSILVFRTSIVLLAASFLIVCLFVSGLAHLGVAVFGGYLILFIASVGGNGFLKRINNKNDISYGVYLYAFPITKLLNWYFPSTGLFMTGIITFLVSLFFGALSWYAIEKPVMRLLRNRRPSSRSGVPPVSHSV